MMDYYKLRSIISCTFAILIIVIVSLLMSTRCSSSNEEFRVVKVGNVYSIEYLNIYGHWISNYYDELTDEGYVIINGELIRIQKYYTNPEEAIKDVNWIRLHLHNSDSKEDYSVVYE